MTRRQRLIWPLLAVFAIAAGPDNFSRDELSRLEAERQAAVEELAALEAAQSGARADVADLDAKLIAAAQESRRRENQATASERRLEDLRARRISATAALTEDEAALEDLLGALMTAGRGRPPALVVSPDAANTSIRSALVMGAAAPVLADRAEALGNEIASLNQVENDIRRELAQLETAEAVLALKRAEITQLAATKRAQFEDVTADAAALRTRIETLGAQAENLKDLLANLEADAPSRPGRKPLPRQQFAALNPSPSGSAGQSQVPTATLRPLGAALDSSLVQPVAGLVAEGFGARRPTGERAKGITIASRQDAQVVAPVDSIIEYAGSFRSYGPTLILRTSDGYYVVLSGLGVIYGTPGQAVRAGEPIGRMPNRTTPAPQLYFELIKGDTSLDPAQWLRRRG